MTHGVGFVPRLVSWDVDGTLYSMPRMKWHLLVLLLGEFGRGRGGLAIRQLGILQRRRRWVEAARKAGHPFTFPQRASHPSLDGLERRWCGTAIQRTGLTPGALALLDFFADKKIPQVVFSDYNAGYKLDILRIRERFQALYEGEFLGLVKPNPEGFLRMAEDFSVNPEAILHVGDRPETDGVAARAVGCHFALFQVAETLRGRWSVESPHK